MPQHILVCGGAGYIGAHAARWLAGAGHRDLREIIASAWRWHAQPRF